MAALGARARRTDGQQPISIMTLDRSFLLSQDAAKLEPMPEDEQDSLTLKVLEASERKQQLIRELLSPQEYNSLSISLFDSHNDLAQPDLEFPRSSKTGLIRPPASTSSASSLNIERQPNTAPSWRGAASGGSEANQTPASLQDRLYKRRKAAEFFFGGQVGAAVASSSRASPTSRDNLAIELRSGFYLSSQSAQTRELEAKIVGRGSLGLSHRLLGLLGLFGLSFDWIGGANGEMPSKGADQSANSPQAGDSGLAEADAEAVRPAGDNMCLLEEHKKFSCKPYTRASNSSALKRRLQSDSGGRQYNKLRQTQRPLTPAAGESQPPAKSTEAPDADWRQTQIDYYNLIKPRPTQAIDIDDEACLLTGCDWSGRGLQVRELPLDDETISSRRRLTPGGNGPGQVNLKLNHLSLLEHKLLAGEERCAQRLTRAGQQLAGFGIVLRKLEQQQLQRWVDKVSSSAVADDRQQLSEFVERLAFAARLIAEFEQKLVLKQQELLAIWVELQSTRLEQQFTLTSVHVVIPSEANGTHADTERLGQSIERLRKLSSGLANELTSKPLVDKAIEQLESLLAHRQQASNRILDLRVELRDAEPPPGRDLPPEEAHRLAALARWLNSLRVHLLIDGRFLYRLRPAVKCEPTRRDGLPQVDLGGTSTIKVGGRRVGLQRSDSIRLQALVYEQTGVFRNEQLVLKSGSFLLRKSRQGCLTLRLAQSGNDDEQLPISMELNLSVEFVSEPEANKGRAGFVWSRSLDSQGEAMFEQLYGNLFRERHSLDGRPRKLANLFNRIDWSCLAPTNSSENSKRSRRYFVLLNWASDQLDAQLSQANLRLRLLNLRWLGAVQSEQRVYLSELENEKQLELRGTLRKLDRLQSSQALAAIRQQPAAAAAAQSMGYKIVELLRTRSADYLKECEALIADTVGFREQLDRLTDRQRAQLLGATSRLASLLREPKFETSIDFAALARSIRQLVPRVGARRPLMPKRGRGRVPTSGRLLARTRGLLNGSAQQPHAELGLDLEAAEQTVLDQWRQAMRQQRRSLDGSRLVVTVQQAANVPLRLVRHPLASASGRPGSPLYPFNQRAQSPGAANRLLASGGASPTTVTRNFVHYLAPAATYVEVVFQRRQLTTSLVAGKNPAWSETLFFPIGFPAANRDPGQPLEGDVRGQLLDECIQLNLYDCRCFSVETELNRDTGLPVGTGLAAPAAPASLGITSVRRQRIERHPIGSLRIPVSLLFSAQGRIQGSFALDPPILLDDYQFEQQPLGWAGQLPAPAGAEHEPSQRTYLTLFITLDPANVAPPRNLCLLPTGSVEHELLFEYAKLWEQVVARFGSARASGASRRAAAGQSSGRVARSAANSNRSHHHHVRHLRTLTMRDDARYCLVVRHLRAQRPPEQLLATPPPPPLPPDQPEASQAAFQCRQLQQLQLARFVALLKPLKYGLLETRLVESSLWFDSRQLLERHLGGPEEKAALLCNYFLFLGVTSGLLLADSISSGRCVYVIVWQKQPLNVASLAVDQLWVNEVLAARDQSAAAAPAPATLVQPPAQPIDRQGFLASLPILIQQKTVELWDPQAGKRLHLNDPLPLLSVGSIVTPENVYANVQTVESPAETNYDIRLRQFWLPLFEQGQQRVAGAAAAAAAASADSARADATREPAANLVEAARHRLLQTRSWRRQLTQLEALRRSVCQSGAYADLVEQLARETGQWSGPDCPRADCELFSVDQCAELRQTLERAAKMQLVSWRPNRPTYFNRTLSRLIGDKLASFESWQAAASGPPVLHYQPSWRAELTNLIRGELELGHLAGAASSSQMTAERRILSWPINLTFTSVKGVLDELFASGMHNADLVVLEDQPTAGKQPADQLGVQFLVACHVHSYPARVLSVWLYVGAILTQPAGRASLVELA